VQLIIGDFSLSLEQAKSQFAIWSIFAAVGGHLCLCSVLNIINVLIVAIVDVHRPAVNQP